MRPILDEARQRWGRAMVLRGDPRVDVRARELALESERLLAGAERTLEQARMRARLGHDPLAGPRGRCDPLGKEPA